MEKTRRERRAEAIKAIKKAVEERGNYIDVHEVIDELYEIDYYDSTNVEDIEILLDLLSEDECHKVEKGGGYKFCSVCGCNITGARDEHYCQGCGCKVMSE